jgi:hypothetical protein
MASAREPARGLAVSQCLPFNSKRLDQELGCQRTLFRNSMRELDERTTSLFAALEVTSGKGPWALLSASHHLDLMAFLESLAGVILGGSCI